MTSLSVAAVLWSASLGAQGVAERIAQGDRERAAMNAPAALRQYQAALQVEPNNAEVLWRASSEAVDLGEFDDKGRDSMYRIGEDYARRAILADAKSSMTHFALAKALGRRALSLGVRERMKYAAEVRKEALESLRLDSLNAGALHVMALWHAHVMSLSGLSRFVLMNLLGGRLFEEANWTDAVALLERAVSLEPTAIVHRLDLARVYRDVGDPVRAREQFELALRLKPAEYNDVSYHREAEHGLRALR